MAQPRRLFVFAFLIMLALPLIAADRKHASKPTTPSPNDYSVSQKEHYLTPNDINYVRPGLAITINSITIGSDRKPVVDLSIADSLGQPIDRLGKTTPGAVSVSFVLAWYSPTTRQFTSYITRIATAAPPSQQVGTKATQATGDSGGKWVDLDTGHATYTFGNTLPSGFDQIPFPNHDRPQLETVHPNARCQFSSPREMQLGIFEVSLFEAESSQ